MSKRGGLKLICFEYEYLIIVVILKFGKRSICKRHFNDKVST